MKKIEVEKVDTYAGHRAAIYCLEKAPESGHFYSASGDGMVVEWRQDFPDLGKPLVQVGNSVYSIAANIPKNELWVGQNFEGIHVVNLTTQSRERSLKMAAAPIFDIKFLEKIALIAGGDGVISVVDTEELAFKKHIKTSDKSVRTIAINPKYHHFAAGYSDNTIRIFNIADYSVLIELNAHDNSVFALHYTPDGEFLLSGSRDARLIRWDVGKQYEKSNEVVGHMYAINDIAFHPDGNIFATCSMDKSIKVWETDTLKLLKVINKGRYVAHGTSVNKLLWTDNPRQLLSASDDRTVASWKIDYL